MIDSRNDRIYAPVVTITLAFGAAGWYSIDFLQKIQYPLLVVLVLLIGLPHGATDFLLFRRLHGPALRNSQVFRFFLFYVLSVLGYLLGWLFIPATALLVFLAISVYHFGQSNWQYAQLPRRVAFISNLAWGCFVLGGVLLWHWDESSIVISQLLGKIPDWSGSAMATWQWMILLLNIFLLIGLRFAGLINRNQFWRELGNFSVLSFMLFHTPMLV